MNIFEYKELKNLTYQQIADQTGIPIAVIHRACVNPEVLIKLKHAKTLVKWSKGIITYGDLAGD